MGLLTSSGISVTTAAVGKAVGIHGQRGGHLGGLTTVDLLHQLAPLVAVAGFGNSAATIALAWMLLATAMAMAMATATATGDSGLQQRR